MNSGITSESQLIDIETIRNGCNQLKGAADDFDKVGDYVNNTGDNSGVDVFSVDNKSFGPSIKSLGEAIKGVKSQIVAEAENILSSAEKIYASQKAELQAYKDKLEKEKQEAEQKNNN